MAQWNMLSFQDAISPMMINLINFHNFTMSMMTLIITYILYILIKINSNTYLSKKNFDNQMIELIWTTMPSIILIAIISPSFKILYMTEEFNSSNLVIKIMSNQWYWTFDYPQFKSSNIIESYLIPSKMLNNSDFQLYEVYDRFIAPFNMKIIFITSSNDVIHSFAIPSLGIKIDSIPGRMNQTLSLIKSPGIFFGQCSEICGINHSQMPIVMEVIPMKLFIKWINENYNNY